MGPDLRGGSAQHHPCCVPGQGHAAHTGWRCTDSPCGRGEAQGCNRSLIHLSFKPIQVHEVRLALLTTNELTKPDWLWPIMSKISLMNERLAIQSCYQTELWGRHNYSARAGGPHGQAWRPGPD
eukprot:scaffold74629_cov20-Prasinocladus_malaysianus.AAC.1